MSVLGPETAEEYFRGGGLIARRMGNFETRPEQLSMAQAVTRSLTAGHHLIVEAGTGTGKSLAYLLPAALWAIENNKKVVVSTCTKTLQQQILNKDIPFLRDGLGLPLRHALCVGFNNYVSLRRLRRAVEGTMSINPEETRHLEAVAGWAAATPSGARHDMPFEPLPAVWEEVNRQKELCLGKRCPSHEQCFYFKARRKWFGAHLLIVNHHLFFANIAGGGGVLPRYDAVIFDEAHHVEEIATQFLGLELSNAVLFYVLDRIYNARTRKGTLTRAVPPRLTGLLGQKVARAREGADLFFDAVFEMYGRRSRVARLYKRPEIEDTVSPRLAELRDDLSLAAGAAETEEDQLEITAAGARLTELHDTLRALLAQQFANYVYWVEIGEPGRYPRAVLRGVPVDVSAELKREVFDKTERVTLTSATLSANRSFQFITERIGCAPRESLALDSPFDYRRQALLYIPGDLPEPAEKDGAYIAKLSRRVEDLVRAAGGKTFILFTSYDAMRRVYEAVEPDLGGRFPLFRQGDMPTAKMIEEFKRAPAVIFGVHSFWQGVDIPGDALQSVIIAKLPFDAPSDPVTEARIERLRQRRLNPFRHYQIPRAIIQLRQGFGRLIRGKSDRGVVSILDSRVVNRGYGKLFIESLPDCRLTGEWSEVERFFAALGNGAQVNAP